MYRLTALVFLLATVFSYVSADDAVHDIVQRSTPTYPGVGVHNPIRSMLRRDDDSY